MKDSCSDNQRMEAAGWVQLALRSLEARCLGDDSLIVVYPARASRNCCLEVLVLAAGMTEKKRWGEAYQRPHSTDCVLLVLVMNIAVGCTYSKMRCGFHWAVSCSCIPAADWGAR